MSNSADERATRFGAIPESRWQVEQMAADPSGVTVLAVREADGPYIAIRVPVWPVRPVDYVELYRAGGAWIARYTSEPAKGRIIGLFGTNELPTAYGAEMSFEAVAAELRAIPANAGVVFVEGRS